MKKRVDVRLADDQYFAVADRAAAEGITKSQLVNDLLREGLAREARRSDAPTGP